MPTALARAIAALGGPAQFRARLGISIRTLANWRTRGVPDVRWIEVARASGCVVSASDLALDRVIALGRGCPRHQPDARD